MYVLREFIVLLVRLAVRLCHAEHAFVTVISIVWLLCLDTDEAFSPSVLVIADVSAHVVCEK